MNPWDLSCRSKLDGPAGTGVKQLPAGFLRPIVAMAPAGTEELKACVDCSSTSPIEANPSQLVPMFAGPIRNTTDHLAAYSTITTANHGGSLKSTSSSRASVSSCSSSSSSSSSTPSSLSSSALSSLAPSPASTRSNSIETSEEIQLVQRVVMFNEQAAATAAAAAKEGLERAIDQLNNTDASNTIINNSNTDTSSSTSSNGSSSTGGGGSGRPPLQDRKARKKDQNRRAAYNYRRKKMEEKNRMREEEMRLVYSRVCLIGYAEKLEGSIMCILQTNTRKILDKDGNSICFLCPICLQSCDNILNLRSHLNVTHNANSNNYKLGE